MTTAGEPSDERVAAWLKTPSPRREDERDVDAAVLHQLRPQGPGPDPAFVRLLLPSTGKPSRRDWWQAEQYVRQWQEEAGLEVDDARRWMKAGVGPDDAALVAFLVEEGITPETAPVPVAHPKTGELATPLDVTRRFLSSLGRSEFASLADALDDAGVERERQRQVPPWLRRVRQRTPELESPPPPRPRRPVRPRLRSSHS